MAQARYTFSLAGGALCLDFANTSGDWPHRREEHLHGFTDVVAWARQAGLLGEAAARGFRHKAERDPARARKAFSRTLELRARIYRIFTALAREAAPDRRDLEALNHALRRALPHLRLESSSGAYRWKWEPAPDDPESMLWPVVRSAAELLASDERRLVRECCSDNCSWLFLDRSRTRRRRWCDMRVCGNRAKARRHYQRTKAAQA